MTSICYYLFGSIF